MTSADEILRIQRDLSFYHGQKNLCFWLMAACGVLTVVGLVLVGLDQLQLHNALGFLSTACLSGIGYAQAGTRIREIESSLG